MRLRIGIRQDPYLGIGELYSGEISGKFHWRKHEKIEMKVDIFIDKKITLSVCILE